MKWKPVDFIIVMLVMIIFVVLGGLELRLYRVAGLLLDDTQSEIYGNLIDAIITIVSVFVGAKIQERRDKE
jgi:hypothetical protein